MTKYQKRTLLGPNGEIIITNPVEIVEGQVKPTYEWVDGKRVYVKEINMGALPNASFKSVATELSNIRVIRLHGMATNGTTWLIMPYFHSNATLGITLYYSSGSVYVEVESDRSAYNGTVYIYFTYN